MRHFFTLFCFLFSFSTMAQLDYSIIEFNNVRATLSNGGVLFNDSEVSNPGYEVPAASGNHLIYSMGFWFGGEDIGGQLKLAASTYAQEADFFPGALTVDGSAEVPLAETGSKGIYRVSKSEIDNHIENFSEPGYDIPENIINWPAHGNIDYGLDFYLAPFIDHDGNGYYEPENGDYPDIRGDYASYFIINDKGGVHESGGDPIGLEAHFMVYQYATDDYLNNTTFINIRLINRGTQSIYNFRGGCFLDSDVGSYDDDYAGCHAENNVMFAYNADNVDEGGGGAPGYGEDPPAVGVVLLSQDAYAIKAGGNWGGLEEGSPAEYYNYMNAIWPDGTHFTEGGTGYGGDTETNFIINGNPNDPEDWSEGSIMSFAGDRRMMMSADLESFVPKQIICLDYAVLYNRDGNRLENAEGIIELAEDVQAFYDDEISAYCESGFLGLDQEERFETFNIFPNPSTGSFQTGLAGNFDLTIFAMDGRLVYQKNQVFSDEIIRPNLASGNYVVVAQQDHKTYQSKLVID